MFSNNRIDAIERTVVMLVLGLAVVMAATAVVLPLFG